MGFIRDLFIKANDFLKQYMGPILDKINQFLQSEEYAVIGVIGLFVVILVLIGLFRWLRKAPKLFFIIVILFALVVVLWVVSKP
jgi:ABC-type bacteriocin/lantibiotic exporter with double-glycine peptidase domain